jgi:O-acetyl-ADP-ribose deacetylase (regulator of RNase III)
MSERKVGQVIIECTLGDITSQSDMDAIVNAANAELQSGGGVAGAIHRAAGPGLARECRPFAPIRPGQALLSGGHRLVNRYVIHCLGPVYGRDEPASELLASCYRNALRLAEQHEVRSIAFPAVSTGAFGYPVEEAATVAMQVLVDEAQGLRHVQNIRMVLFDQRDLEVHRRILTVVVPGARH